MEGSQITLPHRHGRGPPSGLIWAKGHRPHREIVQVRKLVFRGPGGGQTEQTPPHEEGDDPQDAKETKVLALDGHCHNYRKTLGGGSKTPFSAPSPLALGGPSEKVDRSDSPHSNTFLGSKTPLADRSTSRRGEKGRRKEKEKSFGYFPFFFLFFSSTTPPPPPPPPPPSSCSHVFLWQDQVRGPQVH